MHCPPCHGTGRAFRRGEKCQLCKGRGELPDEWENRPICNFCFGTGRGGIAQGHGALCSVCGGYGHLAPEPEPVAVAVDGPLAFFIEAGKPRTAQLRLKDVFASLNGELRICDAYYGTGTLLRLDGLTHCAPVRFLTQIADTRERPQLPRALTEFTAEHPAVEFRRHAGRDLHDRYVLAETEVILLGHGLKDIGSRESFIIRLPKELVGDLLHELRVSFDAKWTGASPLP